MFGSTAYVHISRDSRKKLDSKTRKCILVGYGSVRKGYRLYDRATSQVLFSRNVRFDEQERTGSTPGKETGGEPVPAQNVLELDLDDGSETEENEERIEIRSPPRQPPPRRSDRERRPTDFYGDRVHLTIHQEPTSFNEARSSPEKDQWSRAMDREMESLRTNEVWELTTLPREQSVQNGSTSSEYLAMLTNPCTHILYHTAVPHVNDPLPQ